MKSSTSFVPGGELPVLLERIERREQSARRRTLLYSLLPVTLTVVLLGYTATTVQTATRQVDSLKTEATTYTTRIDTSKKDAESSKAQAQSLQTELENYKNQVTELQTQRQRIGGTFSWQRKSAAGPSRPSPATHQI
jgi:septal ring factor EnvC (AmiA/AmiB activator)